MPDPKSMPDVMEPLKQALFVAVGLGVLAAQRANVSRIEFERRHSSELSSLEAKVEEVLERVEGALPEPARSWVHTTRNAGATAQDRLRHLLGSA
jgi:hypothetical protein